MSSHYTAGQFNDSFQPKCLRNWQLGTNDYPGKFAGCPSRCPKGFIAGNNGHLYPHISRNACTSPWGDYRTSIWEEKVPCACIDMLRNPREYTKPRNAILVTSEMPYPQESDREIILPRYYRRRKVVALDVERPEAARKMIDPTINSPREFYPKSYRVTTKFIADDNGRLFPEFRKKESEEPEPDSDEQDSPYETSPRLEKIKARPTVLWKDVPKYYNDKNDVKKSDEAATFNEEVHERVECLANQNLPIIWIYGLPSTKISKIRADYAKKLARRLKFTYIDMEEQLDMWVDYAGMVQRKMGADNIPQNCGRRGKNSSSTMKYDVRSQDKFLERTIKMSARIKYSDDETLNSSGVVEYCKMAMLHAYPTRGYVLMNFPCCVEEAEIFEQEIWKATTGIYFLESSWSDNKTIEPEILHPPNFRRDLKYKEDEVERTCDRMGYKSIKILNAESVTFREKEVIDTFVDRCIVAYPRILMGERAIFPKAERSFMENPDHPTILDSPISRPRGSSDAQEYGKKTGGDTDEDDNFFDEDENNNSESDDAFT